MKALDKQMKAGEIQPETGIRVCHGWDRGRNDRSLSSEVSSLCPRPCARRALLRGLATGTLTEEDPLVIDQVIREPNVGLQAVERAAGEAG